MLRMSTRFNNTEVTDDLNKAGVGEMMGQKPEYRGLWDKWEEERRWRWYL